MTSERWAEVERVFHAALELAAGDQEAFLERACGGDDALRREVRSLLDHAGTTGAFLERPALEEEARDFSREAPLLGERDIDGYQILSLEGAGGMGEVYRARDLTLGREVALKVLARSAAGGSADLRRFEEEARLASALNHPNIVTIYGVGEQGQLAYIAMELVRGRTLREMLADAPPSVREAIDLALQLADALAAAHAAGIVHRDLKPENLMVTTEGFLKVLDFGIAKLQGSGDPAARSGPAESPASVQTEAGKILGTVGYMSPEQAAGKPARSVSDQFAFGAIFYEMLSGRRAFQRSTRARTLEAVLREQPEPIESLNAGVTPPLRELLARCLAKDPAARFPDTRELAVGLRQIRDGWERSTMAPTRRRAIWLGSAAAVAAAAGVATWALRSRDTGLRSLAVLPFTNVLKDENVDHLCEGMAKGLIRGISRLSSLTVKPFSAVSRFKGERVDPRAVGRQLSADAVVTGTLEQKSGRLVVTASLVGVASGARLWSRTYERAAGDVLSVQDAIASAVVEEGIRLRLSSDDRRQLLRKPSNDPAAYELYLNAIHSFEKETEGDYLAAREFLQKALARDQTFALAYVALASTHSAMTIDGYESPSEGWPEVTRNVRRALDEDQDLPDAHSEAAVALFFSRWDWAGAEKEWNRALESRGGGIVPDFLNVYAVQQFALGKPAEALALVRKAREVDPLSPSLIYHEASFLFHVQQLDEAAALFERVIGAEPGESRAYFGLAEVRRAQGRFDEALAARRRGYKASGDDSLTAVLSTARGAEGCRQVQEAEAQLELEALQRRAADGEYASPLEFARAYAQLGDREHAFDSLDTALVERSPGLVFLNVDRAWDRVRDDPRFAAAAGRVGLPARS